VATPDPRGAFTDIDRAIDPAGFVRVLDTLTALDFVRAYKRRTFALLDVQPGTSVLDLGCGTGDDVQELARLVGPGGRAVGIDRSETVIAQARERAIRHRRGIAVATSLTAGRPAPLRNGWPVSARLCGRPPT
jgi:ubiquinone/menaquinone biosynthesis C-methylase UbiE